MDIHFVDLRNQIPLVQGRFAWYNSHLATFESHAGKETFSTWEEFEEAFKRDYKEESPEYSIPLGDYCALAPGWCFGCYKS